jgi:tRNA(fMet)-specific endonuclease VapC
VRYVLDTNAVSSLMKGDATFVARLRRVRRDDVAVPQPVLAEIAYGISRLPHSRRRRVLAGLFEGIAREIARCPWTDDVSARFGEAKAVLERRGERIEDFDVAIAAHALASGATLVTADMAHMPRIPGLDVEDWTAAAC